MQVLEACLLWRIDGSGKITCPLFEHRSLSFDLQCFPESCLLYKYIVLAQGGGEGMVKAAGGKKRARIGSCLNC